MGPGTGIKGAARSHRGRYRRGGMHVDRIPVTRLAKDETTRLLQMEEVLHQRIVGQDEAITAIAKAVRRARAGLKTRAPHRQFHLPRSHGVARPSS